MIPFVRFKIQNDRAREVGAERAVQQFPIELAADPDLAVRAPEMVTVRVTAIAFFRLLRASIAIKSTWSKFHPFPPFHCQCVIAGSDPYG